MAEETEVVLSANVTPYEQGVNSAIGTTNKMLDSVVKLTTAIDGAFKSAGRTMQIGGAGMLASITAMGLAAGRLDQQMGQLQASMTMISKTQSEYSTRMQDYSKTVSNLRGEFGMTSREAIDLASQLNKLGQSSRNVDQLAASFTKLGAISGESVTGLATAMTQLQRQMGTQGVKQTEVFNKTLAELSQTAGVSATGILQFSQSIAPVAKVAGMAQKEIMGVSTAFLKSGQDGFAAANAFNKMLTDITRSVEYGSPELSAYANLIGVSVDQFKNMPRVESITQIFEAINKQGPQAIKTLERFGLDGVRSLKAIQGVAGAGGIRNAVATAMGADAGAKFDDASSKALDGLNDQLKKMAENGKMIAEAFGSGVAPAMSAIAKSINAVLGPLTSLLQSLGKLPGGAMLLGGLALGAAGAVVKNWAGLSAISVATGAARTVTQGWRAGANPLAPPPPGLNAANLAAYYSHQDRLLGYASPGNFVQHGIYGAAGRAGDAVRNWQANSGGGAGLGGVASRVRSGFMGLANLGGNVLISGLAPTSLRSGRNNFDRDPAYQAFRSSSAADALGWPKVTAAWKEGGSAFKEGGGGLKSVASAAATATTSINNATDSTRKYGSVMGTLGGNALKLSSAMGQSTLTLTRMAAVGSGRLIMSQLPTPEAAVGGVRGVGSAISGALGGPAGMAITGLTMGGMYAWNKAKEGQEADLAMMRNADNKSPGAVYAAALGEASAATKSFADVVKEQNARIKGERYDPKASDQAAEAAAKTRNEYTFAGMRNADLATQKSYIEAVNATNPSDDVKKQLQLDLLRRNGTTAAGRQVTENLLRTAGDGSRLDMTQLYNAAADAQKFSIGGMFQVSSAARDSAESTGGILGASFNQGSSAQSAQRGLTALNKLAKSGAAKDTWYDKMFLGSSSFAQGGVSRQRTKAKAMAYVKSVLGDSATAEDINEVADALNRAGGDPKRMQEILIDSDSVIGENIRQMADITSSTGGNRYATTAPSSRFYESSFLRAGVSQSVLDRMVGSPAVVGNPAAGIAAKDQSWAKNALTASVFSGTSSTGSAVGAAVANQGDVAKQWTAMSKLGDTAINMSGSFSDAARSLDEMKAAVEDVNDPLYQMAISARGYVRQLQSEAMNYMSSSERAQQVVSNYNASVEADLNNPTPESGTNREADRQAVEAVKVDTYNRLKSYVLQVREFNIAQSRGAEDFARQQAYGMEDFNRSRAYAEADFNRSRVYAESDFARQRKHAETDYNRQRKYANFDFQLSRKRSEEDFNRQMVNMARDAAKNIMDIYTRMTVQRTWSAQNLLQNMADQQKRLTEMTENLASLRKAGMSDQTISMMGLNDPNNIQQLARLTDDILANPKLAAQFNSATKSRTATATDIIKDKANTAWTDMLFDFNKNMARGQEDFNRSMARNQENFNIQMTRNQENFGIQMNRSSEQYKISLARQQEAFNISLERMQNQYNLSVQRAGADLNRSMEDISGNFNEMADMALKTLTGTSRQQMLKLLTVLGYTRDETLRMTQNLAKEVNKVFQSLGISPSGTYTSGQGKLMTGTIVIDGQKFNAGQFASGGEIPGTSPHKRADNIPIRATAGEYMQPVDSVEYYGKGFMEAIRDRRIPRGAVQGLADGGAVYKQMSAWADKNLPGLHVTSDYRPGAMTATGFVSDHSKARAIDLAPPSMSAFNRIKSAFGVPNILSLIYSPAGGQNVNRGRLYTPASVTLRDHWDHIHWAMESMSGVGGNGGWDGTYETLLKKIKGIKNIAGLNNLYNKNPLTSLRQLGNDKFAKAAAARGMMMAAMSGNGIDPDYAGLTLSSSGSLKQMVQSMAAQRGWTGSNWTALNSLIQAESGWRPSAQNPTSTAYGLFQFLNSTWKTVGGTKTSDPKMQTVYGLKYIADRYGSPSKAWNFWNSHTPHWYGDGAIFNKATQIGVGDRGPEMVLPLNGRGLEFLNSLMERNAVGAKKAMVTANGVPQQASTVSYYSRVDKSTYITGPITVQSQDPMEMLRKIEAKKKMEALKGRH